MFIDCVHGPAQLLREAMRPSCALRQCRAASDDVAMSQVTFSLGAASFTDSQSPYQWSTSAPPVATATDLELRATAADSSGNVGVATRTLHIQPLAPTTPPVISWK